MTIAQQRFGLVLPLAWVLIASGVVNGVLHCLVARHMCLEDDNCALMLDIVARTCGDTYDGTVCRSPSLETCRGSLQTLWTNPIFAGGCACGDDDVECRHLRDSLSQHPCLKVPRREPNSENVELIGEYPSCTYAFNMCTQYLKCKRIYDYFRKMCKVKDGECGMTNWVKCQRAWTKLQLTPIYGCLCHGEAELEKCAKVYSNIYNNPCIEQLQNWAASYWTSTELPLLQSGEIQWLSVSSTDDPVARGPPVTDHAALPHVVTALTDPEAAATLLGYPAFDRSGSDEGFDDVTDSSLESTEMFGPFKSALHGELIGLPSESSHPNVISLPTKGDEPQVTGPPPDHLPSTAIKAKSTCQRAYHICEQEKSCQVLLGNMLQVCDSETAPCNRTECMAAVQNFYHLGNPSTIRAVAFCICRYNDDVCLIQQRKLHPPCAQRPEVEMPGCHEVAEQCRANAQCRQRMERFVDACAVDRNTLQCQGPLEECRMALVDILGTQLRTNCACSGNDFALLYYCIEWQRMVWLNPCVVQAQKDYHEARLTTPSPPPPPPSPNKVRVPSKPSVIRVPLPSRTTTTTVASTDDPWQDGQDHYEDAVTLLSEITSTDPTEYCVVDRSTDNDIRIAVNFAQRIYDQNNPHCSMVCFCLSGPNLSCKHLDCLEKTPCQTSLAVYSHASPTYVASQGLCLCYSGNFICLKPPENTYNLVPGVYLFLGYSKVDEENVKKHTNVTIGDAIRFLQRMVDKHWPPSCKLTLGEHLGENVILQAYMEDYAVQRENNTVTPEMVNKEDEVCSPVLRNISHLIEKNDPLVRQHVALSLVKLSAVEVHLKGFASAGVNLKPCRVLVLVVVGLVMVKWHRNAHLLGLPP